jgi:transposase
MTRPIERLDMDEVQRQELERIVRSPSSSQRSAQRARAILAKARGLSQEHAARETGMGRRIVGKWCRRFERHGIGGLADAKGRGRRERIAEDVKERVIVDAVRQRATQRRWSVRSMAKHAKVSTATVARLWQANDIKPHRTRTFKLSNDPHFEEKFWDVIGLYLEPPQKALVLCCDEKSQCQALERTQPGLPLGLGHIRTKTHDYVRHGTVTLFAALNYLDGKVISHTAVRHTHRQWLSFLRTVDRETPQKLALHLIIDNYSTHKHPAVRKWLARHPRVHLHFTPTSSSWMNLVERFFRDITVEVVRDGSFKNVNELVAAILQYLEERNLAPRRYVWRKSGAEILEKIHRARAARDRMSAD